MKIILIRHIKSDWSTGKPDFERTIRVDRKADADKIALLLRLKGITPDTIIASPAKRTRQTAMLFAKAFDFPVLQIQYIDSIYESSSQELWSIIQQFNKNSSCVFIVCHNPAITDFINRFTNARIDNVPTCGCAVVENKEGKLLLEAFYSPKN